MGKPQLTLARLMAVVGVIAVNIAAARALYLRDVELALGLALMGLASQFALLRASGVGAGRGRSGRVS